jgi:SAM-dependent methyltransferase
MALHPLIAEHRARWQSKRGLRAIYADYYRRIAAHCVSGRTLEIGGGAGHSRGHLGTVIATDVLYAPWLDAVCDAHALPFAPTSFANMVLFDVLHHLERPATFLAEAVRVLRPGGRLVVLDPAITPVSWPFYAFLHQEPVVMGADPLAEPLRAGRRDPFDSNQAVSTLLFGRHRRRFEAAFPELEILSLRRMSFFAYPLSGGFKAWSLIPAPAVGPVLRLEERLEPLLGPLMAFRQLVVLRRR